MAGIGLKSFKYAKLNEDGKTYGEVKTLAGAIECKVSIDRAEATLYADDSVKEQVSIFKSGTITAGIDDDNDAVFAELLGQTIDEETGAVTSNVNDEPIYVGFGHIVPKMVGGKRKYKVEWFPKVKFKPFIAPAENAGSKNTNLHSDDKREMEQASRLDFSWLLFVGVKILGFTEREVGHMTLKKWNLLFNHFKKYHNFRAKAGLFKEEKEVTQSDEWIKD